MPFWGSLIKIRVLGVYFGAPSSVLRRKLTEVMAPMYTWPNPQCKFVGQRVRFRATLFRRVPHKVSNRGNCGNNESRSSAAQAPSELHYIPFKFDRRCGGPLQEPYPIVPLKQIEYGVYGDLIALHPKPHCIYLRGTMTFKR